MKFSDKVVFKNGYEEDNFVGIKYKKDKVYIYLPIGYDKEIFNVEKELSLKQKTDLLLFLKTINLVKSLYNEKTELGINSGENNEIPYNSFLWLINDYFNNGLYQEVEKRYFQKSHGKINWKRTLNSEHYFENDRVVYVNPYYESNVQINTLITELNNFCLHISFKYIGFLFGKVNLLKCNLKEEKVKENLKYYINIINKELSKSFNDRKKLLLSSMKRIIEMSFNENIANQESFGTRKYEYAWEKMINTTLGTKIDISKFFPNAYWNIQGQIGEDKSKLRPDSILIDSRTKKIYILDAKYYKYGITGNMYDLPHTDSIQKQITYGDHIANNPQIYGIEKNSIFNAFILPFNKNKEPFKCSESMKYLGFASSAWRDKKANYNYEKISLLLMDTKYVIDCFYHNEKADIAKLIETIEISCKK